MRAARGCRAGRGGVLSRRRWGRRWLRDDVDGPAASEESETPADWLRICAEAAKAAEEANYRDEQLRQEKVPRFPPEFDDALSAAIASTRPPAEQAEAQRKLLQAVRACANRVKPPPSAADGASNCDVFHFGSTAMALSFPGGDLDLSLTWEGHDNLAEDEPEALLKELTDRVIESGDFSEIELVGSARIPVLAARHIGTGLTTDVVVSSPGADLKSPALGYVVHADSRFATLARITKLWARRHGFNNPKKHTFNSWCLALLSAFHLQTAPAAGPRLVPFADLLPEGDEDTSRRDQQLRREALQAMRRNARQLGKQLRQLPKVSPAALLYRYFEHFSQCSPTWQRGTCAGLLEGQWRPPTEAERETQLRKGAMRVVDPFQRGDNCARTLDARRAKYFSVKCEEMLDVMRSVAKKGVSSEEGVRLLLGDVAELVAGIQQPVLEPEGEPSEQLIVRLHPYFCQSEQQAATALGEGDSSSGLVEVGGYRAGADGRPGRIFARYRTVEQAESVHKMGLKQKLVRVALQRGDEAGPLGFKLLPRTSVVSEVHSDSCAAQAGVRPHMRVLSIDGTRVNAGTVRAVLADTLATLAPGQPLKFVFAPPDDPWVPLRFRKVVIGTEWPYQPMLREDGHSVVASRPVHPGRKVPLGDALAKAGSEEPLIGKWMSAPHSSAVYIFEGLEEQDAGSITFVRRQRGVESTISIADYFTHNIGIPVGSDSKIARARSVQGRYAGQLSQLPVDIMLLWVQEE
eukprot:TRINITY_DN55431_c0_g1_i1.p1 TRINITY_DN55431_c0_g1~~TRINITY_DN55431_c0_g1_i1.p1  ORF type:complete len:747 (+),score=189.24 TRINITY_DN55431_c0_g1_i1:94-2334(+)